MTLLVLSKARQRPSRRAEARRYENFTAIVHVLRPIIRGELWQK